VNQALLALGTEHKCPKCGATYRCDEEGCAVPFEAQCAACIGEWAQRHHDYTHNQCKRDPVYAAKIARIMARKQDAARGCNPIEAEVRREAV
jgi:hypothetical protein